MLAQNGKTAEWELNKGIWTVSINSGSADLLMVSYSFGIPSFFFSFVGSLVRWFLLSFFGSLVRSLVYLLVIRFFIPRGLLVCSFFLSFFRVVRWLVSWLVGWFLRWFFRVVRWLVSVGVLVGSFVRSWFVRSFFRVVRWLLSVGVLVGWLVGSIIYFTFPH